MNRRISDLLDAYQDDSVELNCPTPLSSARIKELTMKKIAPKQNKLHRLPVRLLAVAAVIAALTVSAFAAIRIAGAGNLMQGLFEQWRAEPLTTTQVETLNEVGYVFDGGDGHSATSNGATITLISALADADCLYLHLRVEAPEGTVLPDLDWSLNTPQSGLDLSARSRYTLYGSGSEETGNSNYQDLEIKVYETPDKRNYTLYKKMVYNCYTLPDDDPTDNVKELALMINSSEFNGRIKLNDSLPITLTLKGLWVLSVSDVDFTSLPDITFTQVFRGNFTLDINAHFDTRAAVIDCGGAVWSDPDTGETNCLDTIKLSPLGVKFEFLSNIREDNGRTLPLIPGDVRIVMKDGSEISFEHSRSTYLDADHPDWRDDPYYQVNASILSQTPEWEYGCYTYFLTPVALEDVDYVQFGEDNIYHISME